MAKKQIKAKVGQTVDYKIIKDTYKTVTDRFVVSEDMDKVSTIDLSAPTESYTPTADYTISKLGEYKIITFNNDIVLPDDVVMEKDEYVLLPYSDTLYEIDDKKMQGILDKETDATTLKLFANTLVMEKGYGRIQFKQPTISSNGVIGEDDFACSTTKGVYGSSYLYYVFNDDNNIWHSNQGSSPWDIIYYSKEAIKPTKINIINRNNDPSYVYPATSLTVYGSVDGDEYTQIGYTTNSVTANAGQWSCDIETPMEVHYLKFVFTNNYSYFALTYIGIEGETYGPTSHEGILLLAEDKNLQNDGLFIQYIGDVEIPTFEETDTTSTTYYAWTTTTSGATPTTVYTISTTPSVGDVIYDENGEATTMTAIGVASDYSYINPGTSPAFFLPPEYYRDSENDIMSGGLESEIITNDEVVDVVTGEQL